MGEVSEDFIAYKQKSTGVAPSVSDIIRRGRIVGVERTCVGSRGGGREKVRGKSEERRGKSEERRGKSEE